jgi:hypothetical protein
LNDFALGAFELSAEDTALLKSLMTLAAHKTRANWRWTDDVASANVVVIPGSLQDEMLAREARLSLAGGPQHPILLVDADASNVPGRLALRRPARVSDIVHCLEAAQIMIQSREAVKLKFATLPQGLVWVEPHPDAVSVIDITSIDESGGPIQHHTSLYSAVAEQFALRREGVFSIRGNDWEPIYVLPARRQFLSLTDVLSNVQVGVEKLRSALSRHSGSVVVEEIINIDLLCDVLRRRTEPGYRLVWLSAITLPAQLQTQYIDPAKSYLLKRTPDFSDLMHSEADLRMAAVLTQMPLNARGLALLSGASIAGARSFLMACYASGLLMSNHSQSAAKSSTKAAAHAVSKQVSALNSNVVANIETPPIATPASPQ